MDHIRISGTEPSLVILSQTMKFKTLLISSAKFGSKTEHAYSKDGHRNDWYACSFTDVELMFRFLCKNLMYSLPFCDVIYITIPFQV